jgi:hypothetical protein
LLRLFQRSEVLRAKSTAGFLGARPSQDQVS